MKFKNNVLINLATWLFSIALVYLLLVFVFSSCKKENVEPKNQTEEPTTIDCDCDRVVTSTSFNMPGGIVYGTYSTVNDCTNLTVNGEWSSQNGETKPVVGTCL